MSLNNIANIVESLSKESGKLSENELVDLYVLLTGNETMLAEVQNLCNLLPTNSAKLKYLRGLSKKSKSTKSESEQPGAFDDFASLKRGIIQVVKEEVGREVKKVRLFLEGSMSSQGYSTLSDIGGIAQQGLDIDFPLKLTDIVKAKSPGKFSNPPNKDNQVTESEVQEYFISECRALEKFGTLNNKLIVKDTHASPLLGTRKPDFVFIQRNSTTDPLNVVVVGVLHFVNNLCNGSNTDVGQAISFGEKVLQLQPRRMFVYVVLTDCIKINIFIVYRMDRNTNHSEKITNYTYEHIKSENLEFTKDKENKGWRYLVTIMESSPNLLGWIEPSLKFSTGDVKLVRSIGMGRTSVVYEGTFNEESVVVKMAKKADYFPCFESERNVLQELSKFKSPHIPKVILHNESTLVMTPLGEKIHNLQKGDFKDIIKVFELVHSLNYVHRDLRKYNFIRDESGKIVIIDWGYCIKTNINDSTFAGALEVMPDKVLLSIINEKDINYGPEVDLVCLVRSFYLMLHRPLLNRAPFDKDDDIKARAQVILNFWKDCGQSDVWNNIYSAIDDLDYGQLILELERLF